MGSSPGSDNQPPPAPQGPPIEQLQPAQPPPKYAEFLPTQANAPPPTGLTQQMLDQIAASAAPAPLQQAAIPGTAAPGTGAMNSGDAERQVLAQVLTKLLQPNMSQGGGSNRAGYTTSGPGGTSGFGGRSSSASNTGGAY